LLVELGQAVTEEQAERLMAEVGADGGHLSPDNRRLVLLGNGVALRRERLAESPLVRGFRSLEELPYPLASRAFLPAGGVVSVGDQGVKIGVPGQPVIIAGPCSVESPDQILETALAVARQGAAILRGGAYKPRTSPHSFQGFGCDAIKWLQEAGREAGLPTVSEVMDPRDVDTVASRVDMLQIGSRNMQNFALLAETARSGRPVMLKRGMWASVEEWLLAAEHLLAVGAAGVVLCERGVRSAATSGVPGTVGQGNTILDLNAVVAAKLETHLPVIVDPSHGAGYAPLVAPLARAGLAAGADGIMVEVHPDPSQALSDGKQSLTFEEFSRLFDSISQSQQVHG